MIRLNQLHKYYNRKKSNEIHVLNDITYDFPEKGLVCLFGPSGCGKTTLLNAICGLDSIHSGLIEFEDARISKYNTKEWDAIRSQKFGYIFQNYVLFEEISVYENLAFVLKAFDLSKEELDERIEYALAAVGMEKYKKRLPKQLSGGQQQRIAIARALVKSPSIIVADEPTGNLDEKNTNQIMNIIKKLSSECLVILVTHERRLADFYADQIIELKDGQITNVITNTNSNIYEFKDDRTIYLQEFAKNEYQEDNMSIQYFTDRPLEQPVQLKIIVKDGVIYVANNNQKQKTTVVSAQSEMKIVDSKKPQMTLEEMDAFEYDLESIPKDRITKKGYISFKASLKIAWLALSNLGRKKKIYLATFFLAAVMIVITAIRLVGVLYVDENDYLVADRNLVTLSETPGNATFIQTTKDLLDTDYILFSEFVAWEPGGINIRNIRFNVFDQAMYAWGGGSIYLDQHSILPMEVVDEPRIILGRLPEKYGEITMDKRYIDTLLEKNTDLIRLGGYTYSQFLYLTYTATDGTQGQVVGITDMNSPTLLMKYDEYVNNYFVYIGQYSWNRDFGQITPYSISSSSKYASDTIVTLIDNSVVELKDVTLGRNQVLVAESVRTDQASINLFTISSQQYEIVGTFSGSGMMYNSVIVSSFYLKDIAEEYYELTGKASIYSSNPTVAAETLNEAGVEAESLYHYMYNQYMLRNAISLIGLFFPVMILIASFIFLYFMMRSSIIARIYEVGVYRALGVRRLEVTKIFFAEVLLLTLVTSVPGFLIVSLVINRLNAAFVSINIFYPWYLALGSITFILFLNFIVGLIPVQNVLKFTPAQILNKYDI